MSSNAPDFYRTDTRSAFLSHYLIRVSLADFSNFNEKVSLCRIAR